MKRFASIIAIAALSLPFATSVSANELDYALAYQAAIKQSVKFQREDPTGYSDHLIQSYRYLHGELLVDRDKVFNYVGAVKTDMCKRGESAKEYYTGTVWDKTWGDKPATAANQLAAFSNLFQLLEIYNLPCK